jgi:hypothetical protein
MLIGILVSGVIAVALHAPQPKTPPARGPAGTKFVSVNGPKEDTASWRFPSITEIAVHIGYYQGGFEHSGDASPQEIHRDILETVENSLRAAEAAGVATGRTAFDPHLDRTPAPKPGMPRKNVYFGQEP